MNRITIAALGIVMLAAASCTKEELRPEQQYMEPAAEVAVAAPVASVSDWQAVTEWSNAQENGALQLGKISSTGITATVADNGLVLVFARNGDRMQSLPYTNGDIHWNYQVEEGKVVINASSASVVKIDRQQQFQYIVLSKEQLDALETKGVSKNDLVNLSYEQAITLFNN